MESLERDIRARVLLGEMLDDLVAGRFAWAIPDVAWLDDLARGRRDVDHDPRARKRERQELLDDVEGTNHIGVESELVVGSRDLFAWNEGVGCSDVRYQDVDLANLLENGRDAVEVGDRRGVRGDFGVGILGLKDLLCFAENFGSSLHKNEMLDVGFGEGFRDREADAACLEDLVVGQPSLR